MRVVAPGFRLGAAAGVSFSPSGRLLGQVGRQVAVYSVSERRRVTRSEWHFRHPSHIAFAGSDDWFAVRSTTGALVVAEVEGGHPMSRLAPTGDEADDSGIFVGPGDEHVIEACASGTLRIRRVDGLGVEYAEDHPHCLLVAATSRDRTAMAVAYNYRALDSVSPPPPSRIEIRTWPYGSGTRHTLGARYGTVHSIAFSADGNRIAVMEGTGVQGERSISILDASTGALHLRSTSASWAPHHGFALSPDGAWIVVGTWRGHSLLDAHALSFAGHLSGEYTSDAAFSSDGQLLALGYWDAGVVISTRAIRDWFPEPEPEVQIRSS